MPTESPWAQQATLYHAREDRRMLDRLTIQPGVGDAGDFKITPQTGLNLQAAAGSAWVAGSHAGVTRQGLYPVALAAAETGIAVGAAHATLPRIDQVVLRIRDTEPAPATAGDAENSGKLEVVAGTATSGATLDNRNGAASLPASTLRLADVLVPAAFTGPFVQNTHLRDRRPWAHGAYAANVDSTSGIVQITNTAFTSGILTATRLEFSGAPVLVRASAVFSGTAASTHTTHMGLMIDGSTTAAREVFFTTGAVASALVLNGIWVLTTADLPIGSHTLNISLMSNNGQSSQLERSATRPLTMVIRELVGQQSTANTGA